MTQVIGEILLTVGAVALLFVVWELGWTTVQANASQRAAIDSFAQDFQGNLAPGPAGPSAASSYGDPASTPLPSTEGEVFGVVYIPRFGQNYEPRPMVQGTGQRELDTLGLGHYESTAMPGEVGNFVLAGHRQTHGATLDAIHTLVPGDKIYVQTTAGYYSYVYRNFAIVLPSQSEVLAPVPMQMGTAPEDRYLTLTTCNPRFGASERFIAYAVFDSWQPLDAGPPQEIADQVRSAMGGE